MNSKQLSLLGFACKAGKLSFGMDAVCTAINKRQAKLIVTADDVSDKSKKEITFFANKQNIPVIVLENCNKETLTCAVGRKCGIVSVNDSGFATALCDYVNHRREC